MTKPQLSLEDFSLIKVVGRGCTSKVLLVRHRKSKQLFALKSIRKRWIVENEQFEHLRAERDILASLSSSPCSAGEDKEKNLDGAVDGRDFLIHLHAAFQSPTDLFYLLDYHPGGDLASLLARHLRLPEPTVVFYVAQIALALYALHARSVVYRDLKPENVLFDSSGNIVLTDSGLSKMLRRLPDGRVEAATTFCGTAEYLRQKSCQDTHMDLRWIGGAMALVSMRCSLER